MNQNKNILISDIKKLSNLLDKQYNLELNFRNHCYLRIAYDAVFQDKWDCIVKKPFTKFANEEQLIQAIQLLKIYQNDKSKLLLDNQQSLVFRQRKNAIKIIPDTLF